MIEDFPENHELIWLFESEPEILNPQEPWLFNTITFKTQRNGLEVVCSILPSYGDLSLRLSLQETEIVAVDFFRIRRSSIRNEKGCEALVVEFGEASDFKTFELQLKPHVHLSWGNHFL
ncbi:hypothetical protein [Deinococcus aestuarii]|uniref:hypothetical protein n=1 Tax=Deinococcus aestuarii TaxID=2774531 RepID=UPI001C0BD40C|nr:hypothetical protein [Deinococcus aestuarii]